MKKYVLVKVMDSSNVYDLFNQTDVKLYGTLKEAKEALKNEVDQMLKHLEEVNTENGNLDDMDMEDLVEVIENNENFVTIHDLDEECYYNFFIKEV